MTPICALAKLPPLPAPGAKCGKPIPPVAWKSCHQFLPSAPRERKGHGENQQRLGLSQFRQEAVSCWRASPGDKGQNWSSRDKARWELVGTRSEGKYAVSPSDSTRTHCIHRVCPAPTSTRTPGTISVSPSRNSVCACGTGKELLHVAGAIALRGMVGVFPFAALHKISRARKSRHQLSILAPNIPPAMVKVQVGVDDDVDILQDQVQFSSSPGRVREWSTP